MKAQIRILGSRPHPRTSNSLRTNKYKRKQIDIGPRKWSGYDGQVTLSEERYHLA